MHGVHVVGQRILLCACASTMCDDHASVLAHNLPASTCHAHGPVAIHRHTYLPLTAKHAAPPPPVYQSGPVGEGSGKFLSLGSGPKATTPSHTIQLAGGGLHDLALSPDGCKLAAACADGALRVVDMATGTVVGG